VFKRRDRKPLWQSLWHLVWPKGGWVRAFEYVKHRLRRLPDTPEKIARGISAGVFTSFTPFFGMHFIMAWLFARTLRGNVPAALLGTFFGNPLTYVPIAVSSLTMGHFLLGTRPDRTVHVTLMGKFSGAGSDLWHNFLAMFTDAKADWHALSIFFEDVFLPFAVGSIIPGLLTAVVMYYVTLPVIRVYQNSRRKRLKSRLKQLNKLS
jgi:uncharacterized protein (DUF2062 family)